MNTGIEDSANIITSLAQTNFESIHKLVELNVTEQAEIQRLRHAMRKKAHPTKIPPPKVMPMFETIGQSLQLDPYEVMLMMTSAFSEPDETVNAALRHIMMVGRLRSNANIAEYRNRRNEAEVLYAEAMQKWHDHELQRKKAEEDFELLTNANSDLLYDRWFSIIDIAEAELNAVDNHIPSVPIKTQIFARALVKSSRFFLLEDNGNRLIADWVQARKFHREHISNMLRGLLKDLEEYELNNPSLTVPDPVLSSEE